MSSGTKVGPGPGDIVLDGDPAPLNKEAHNPQFWSMSFFGQTAGWMKLILGMVVGLSPEFVLDGDPAPSPKRGRAPSLILRVEVENLEIGPEVMAVQGLTL